jgi:hypothetical protein
MRGQSGANQVPIGGQLEFNCGPIAGPIQRPIMGEWGDDGGPIMGQPGAEQEATQKPLCWSIGSYLENEWGAD